MKKINLLISLCVILIFIASCGSNFNPRYYYNKNKNFGSGSGEPPTDLGGGSSEPQIPQGHWNDLNYKFDGSIIKDYLFGASFDNDNVPSYKFFKNGAVWTLKDSIQNAYHYDGVNDGNIAQGYGIKPANFTKYDGKNPLIVPNSPYNQYKIMKRFLFYRLEGKAVIVPLNNFLIAVDTYSKFVFAYGKITKTENAPLVGTPYPVEFKPVELFGDRRNFWEYDPIGIMVYENGELKLELYDEYRKEMAKDANAFFPQVHNPNRPMASRNAPGVSPYFDKSTDVNRVNVIVSSKSIKNISVKSYYKKFFGSWQLKPEAYLVYATRAAIYEDPLAKAFEMLGNHGGGNELGFGAGAKSVVTIANNSSINSEKSMKYSISNIGKSKFKIDIDTKFIKYNWTSGRPDYSGTVTYISKYDNSLLSLSYDGASKTFKVINKQNKVVSCTPQSFTLDKGKSQDIVIKYSDYNDNRTEEWEITYNVKIE